MVSSFPPELFGIVASHIPLPDVIPTLCALASANQQTHAIVQPLIFVRLVLPNEDVALKGIRKILQDPSLGSAVRELYVMSSLSPATRRGEREDDVITSLRQVIEKALLPRVRALGIYMLPGWIRDEDYQSITGYGHLSAEFWQHVRTYCPNLRTLILRGVQDSDDDPWLDDSVVDEINTFKDLTCINFVFPVGSPRGNGGEKIIKNLIHLAPSLHSLTLAINGNGITDAGKVFAHYFPNLQVLELYEFGCDDLAEAMLFWSRHCTLERLVLDSFGECWFSDSISPGFLPNLVYLKVDYQNARILAPILNQLICLSVTKSYNLQIPYLLRSVIAGGVPHLRSLEIDQTPTSDRKLCRNEGAMWYETPDGKFLEEKKFRKAVKAMTDNYMPSIFKSAPNLEELGLRGNMYSSATIVQKFCPLLSQFERLQRFYYEGCCDSSDQTEENVADFLVSSRSLGQSCSQLISVTDSSPRALPYITARIIRGPGGHVEGVVCQKGFGMERGREDDPFPQSRRF